MRFRRPGSSTRPPRSAPRQRWLRAEQLEARRVLAAAIGSTIWQDIADDSVGQYEGTSYLAAVEYDLFSLDLATLRSGLSEAPAATTPAEAQPTLSLPRPDGSYEQFRFVYDPIYAAGFAEQFPDIKTFGGRSLEDPASTVRFDITPHGFHAQVRAPDGGYTIDPYFHLSDAPIYASYPTYGEYDLSQYTTRFGDGSDLDVLSLDDEHDEEHDHGETGALAGFGGGATGGSSGSFETGASSSGTQLRTYRAAIAAAGEYTVFHGGTVAAAQAAIVTSMNRIVGVLEQELTVRLELVANNADIAFTDPTSDPYTGGGNLLANLGENQATVDSRIGVANYDIGHVFITGGGGLAYLRSVGVDAIKAGAATSITPPVGEYFNLVTLHEMGHQFGANHTFSGDSGGCAGNANAGTAVEPGGGSTIMSYAGICGNDNLQTLMDANYHSVSVDEILDHIDRRIVTVGQRSNTINTVPVVSAGRDYTIPADTPFVLTAVGFDADGNDTLTYSWEQRNVGPQRDLNAGDDGVSTLFRVWPPDPSPSRYFPRLSDLVNNQLAPGETMPVTNRTMDFRVTVRDNNLGAGAINTSDMTITVVNTGTPFTVLTPNTAVTWDGLSQQTITWDVAGTTAAPISAQEVSIYFSADGGLTYPFQVADHVPNIGTANIFVPNVDTTQGRVMVRGADNVFFDISDANLTVDAVPIDIRLDTGAATYVENAPPIAVSPGAAVVDTGNLSGLSVDVNITQGFRFGDRLSLLASGPISVSGGSVLHNGTNIGSYATAGEGFSIRLNANATPQATQDLIRAVAFENTTDAPTNTVREVEFVFGGTISAKRNIDVVPVNDPPRVSDAFINPILEDILVPSGGSVSSILAGRVLDPDTGASLAGVAIVDNPQNAAEGTWYYSSGGGTNWAPIGFVDDGGQSLVLSSSSFIGFLPASNYFGLPQPLRVRALDDTYAGGFSDSDAALPVFLDPASRDVTGAASTNTAAIRIEVTNVNDPPIANQASITINLLQDEAIDRVFLDSLFTDIDSPALTWSMTSSTGGALPAWLSFNAALHKLQGTPRNRDVGNYSLLLRVTDNQQATVAIPVNVTVANVNDPPTNLRLVGNVVTENEINRVVGELFATDPDAGDLINWSVSDPRFTVRDGLLVLNSGVDYETEQSIQLVITATDTGTPPQSAQLPVTITVIDENEFFPQLAGETFSIPDRTPAGTRLRTLSAPDADIRQTVKYRLKSGDTSFFQLNANSGELTLAAQANLASKASYRVFIEAYDNGVPFKAQTSQFIINVEPVNNFAPTVPSPQALTFAENLPAGSLVGRVQASDADGNPLRFELFGETSGVSGWLTIDPLTGDLRTTALAQFDFENPSNYAAIVRATETVAPFRATSAVLTVSTTDVNDPPTAISDFEVRALQFGYPTVGDFSVADQDPSSGYALATADPRFEIRNGKLALKSNFYFTAAEAGTTTQVMVTVTDNSDPSSFAQLPAQVHILANPSPWQNPILNVDVNRDGNVTASDVLSVVNAINQAGGVSLALSVPRTLAEYSQPDIDVSGNNVLSALDVLLVVNYINAQPEAEPPAEASPLAAAVPTPDVWMSAYSSLEEEVKRRRL